MNKKQDESQQITMEIIIGVILLAGAYFILKYGWLAMICLDTLLVTPIVWLGAIVIAVFVVLSSIFF